MARKVKIKNISKGQLGLYCIHRDGKRLDLAPNESFVIDANLLHPDYQRVFNNRNWLEIIFDYVEPPVIDTSTSAILTATII
jgi:hypothetical protein